MSFPSLSESSARRLWKRRKQTTKRFPISPRVGNLETRFPSGIGPRVVCWWLGCTKIRLYFSIDLAVGYVFKHNKKKILLNYERDQKMFRSRAFGLKMKRFCIFSPLRKKRAFLVGLMNWPSVQNSLSLSTICSENFRTIGSFLQFALRTLVNSVRRAILQNSLESRGACVF